MHAIYAAQNRYFSEEIVLLDKAPAGRYLVKIGWAYDLCDRMLSINKKHPTKHYPYLDRGGWKFVCFRPVVPWRLRTSEKDSHRVFGQYKLSDDIRDRIAEHRNSGYELFLGGEVMLDELRKEFIHPTIECVGLENYQDYCQTAFLPTAMPSLPGPFS